VTFWQWVEAAARLVLIGLLAGAIAIVLTIILVSVFIEIFTFTI
jgi:hypothetical protein